MVINCASCQHANRFWWTSDMTPFEAECDLTNERHPGDHVCDQWLGRDSYGNFLRQEIRDEPNAAD
jgi:hypothetical protein